MELVDFSRFAFALLFVVGAIWLLAYIMKRTGMDKRLRGISGQQGRLSIIDVLYLDPKRKLTLVREGSREYLIFLSGDHAQLIEAKDATPHEPTA